MHPRHVKRLKIKPAEDGAPAKLDEKSLTFCFKVAKPKAGVAIWWTFTTVIKCYRAAASFHGMPAAVTPHP